MPHKSGPLKQENKKHKGANGKRALKRAMGAGKAIKSKKGEFVNNKVGESKAARQNKNNQLRKDKREEAILQKRLGCGTVTGPPKIVVLFALSELADIDMVLQSCTAVSDGAIKVAEEASFTYAYYASEKSRFTFVRPRTRDFSTILDTCKVADIVLVVASVSAGLEMMIDEIGVTALSTLQAVGCPDLVCCLQGLSAELERAQHDIKRDAIRHIESVVSVPITPFEDYNAPSMCRHLCSSAVKGITWRNTRSYMMTDHIEHMTSTDVTSGSIRVQGYLRGKPLDINSLVHIPGVGTGRIAQIESLSDPFAATPVSFHGKKSVGPQVFLANPEEQDSLDFLANPDGISGEQTWPSDAEMTGGMGEESAVTLSAFDSKADKSVGRNRRVVPKSLPSGMSSYQADWYVDEEGEFEDDDGEEGDEEDDDGDSITIGSIGRAMNPAQALAEKRLMMTTIRELADMDNEFPDEMDTPTEVSARTRFARYRALQSFRSSPWNPKENLPVEYSRIFQFANFSGSQKKILDEYRAAENRQKDVESSIIKRKSKKSSSSCGRSRAGSMLSVDGMDSMESDIGVSTSAGDDFTSLDDSDSILLPCKSGPGSKTSMDSDEGSLTDGSSYIKSGRWIAITITDLPVGGCEAALHQQQQHGHFSLYSLLKHENKLSVSHFTIERTRYYTEPIKSKEPLIFHVGFRSFQTKPIFSESNLNCDKHKSERFLLPGKFTVASCYAPITYAPCPVLVYKQLEDGSTVLVATGSLSSVDPDRIMLKKVILTGLPVRVRKKTAVVKHLFYDPQDVRWFKPAELVTKHGLRGHITEPVGTHGLFKALFSAPITQNDTIMLILYKRVYPKIPLGDIIIR